MPIITKDQLVKYLWKSEVDTYTSRISPVKFDVEVAYQNKMLYKYQALDSQISVLAPEEQSDLKEVLDRSGMYELEVEFNPASEAKIEIKNGKLDLPDGTYIPTKIRTSHPTFSRWFQQACALLGAKVYLIPDTNVSRRMYYTNHLRPILIENESHSLAIAIPRLVMLEIESTYNRSKPSDPSPKLQEKDKDFYTQNEKRKAKERRIAFQSMGETLFMKNDGAIILPNADMSLIRSFSSESGMGNADASIRKEISNCKHELVKHTVQPGGVSRGSNVAFLTCDLMNSLAATAEDLNTIYFYRLEDKIQSYKSYEELTTLIFNTAVHFEECEITLRGKGHEEQFRCTGTWSGKSVFDWQNNHIMIDRIANSRKLIR